MEKYTQKLNFEENEQPDFDDIYYDEEYDDEIDSDEGGDAFDELRRFAKLFTVFRVLGWLSPSSFS